MDTAVETHLISRGQGKAGKAMDVKQSFQNIMSWVKKNPILAGGIVLVLVLIAWWVSKQGGGNSGSMATEEEESIPDFGSAPMLGGGNDTSLLDTVNEPVAGVTQPAPIYDAPVFENLPSIPEMQSGGFFDPGSVQDLVTATPQASSLGVAMASIGAPKKTVSGVAAATAGASLGATKSPGAQRPTEALVPTLAKLTGRGVTKSRTPVTASTRSSVVSPTFTGYKNGIFYLRGVPMTSSIIAPTQPLGTTGSRTPTTKKPGRGRGR